MSFWLATQDTFDYSDFIFVGGLAGITMAGKSQPSFGQGGEASANTTGTSLSTAP